MRQKPATMGPEREVAYTDARWVFLREKRAQAERVLGTLAARSLRAGAFGSLARGDVRRESDVDITVLEVASSLDVELALEPLGVAGRRIQQATPQAVPKALVEVEDGATVSFPLTAPGRRERDFYSFAGYLEAPLGERRVAGVDKRLMLIRPTPSGHVETPLSDVSPGTAARLLGVGQAIVEERLRVLLRRAEVGRTGTYLNEAVPPGETFESVLREIVDRDPAVRRRVRGARG